MLLEAPFRCKPLSKRGEEAPLPGWLDGPGDPVDETECAADGAPRGCLQVHAAGKQTGTRMHLEPQAGCAIPRSAREQTSPGLQASAGLTPPHGHPFGVRRKRGRGQAGSAFSQAQGDSSRSRPIPSPHGFTKLHSPPLG